MGRIEALRDRGTLTVRKSHIKNLTCRSQDGNHWLYKLDYGSRGSSLSCTKSSIDEGPLARK